MPAKRNVSETAPGSAAAPARAKKTATSHSRRTKTAATEPETTAAPAGDATPQMAEPLTATASATVEITHEQIARLAHSYWEARGCQGGSPEEDWARAEQELRGRG
jgi:hypothetical protein